VSRQLKRENGTVQLAAILSAAKNHRSDFDTDALLRSA
jgi:hypothetical protein